LFKLFRVERVEELPLEAMLELIRRRAEHDAPTVPAARQLLAQFPERRRHLQAVLHLCGGAPRLALMLYQVAAHGQAEEAQAALGGLLDQLSPYFQERMRRLSAQRRKIVIALADSDGVLTPTQIAQRARLGEPKKVVAQIGQLVDLGWVRRVKQARSREVYYTLREILFRYWHQWRTAPQRRARLRVFVEFLSLFYGLEELSEQPDQHRNRLVTLIDLLQAGHPQTALDRIAEFQAAAPAEERNLFFPVEVAARYLLEGDPKVLDRLAPEVREVVEALIAKATGDAEGP
jgi:DNA-binding MarR family transcriptional regulator